ncbi:PqiC family protein [Legionella cardiaca]|uniref:PqiC family protein n=1 Tax=Legionella cardiaca TaxID=1071983 RepID=A0ABY8ASA8_9GAMM|nr:PqiC family protein [Legionella cardiaca]WED43565.1 PqiC family protein [Legionella cardiaca]
MKLIKFSFIAFIGLLLVACGRSKDAQMYMLNPLPPAKNGTKPYTYLQIGIDEVTTPAYMTKPQLMIHQTPHRLELEEYHQWAESLDKNITRVVETNLATLLPGAVVESSPWDSKFKPNYHLQIDISQFEIDINGNSTLRAEYLIYHEDKLIKKRDVYYCSKVMPVDIERLVISMNVNLTHLTQDIAKTFATEYRQTK